MEVFFAPMEGLTDSIYRKLHHRYFPGVDRYYMPFLSPTVHRSLTPREARELPPACEHDFLCVPQLLTKNADDFIWMAQQCADRGYREVNLNLGCPSGTVTAKGKGSGMLRDLDQLALFLDTVFREAPLPVSIKTRIGFDSSERFPDLMELFNQYPICSLTVHPRLRSAFYKGPVDREAFRYAASVSKNPLCYNGDLCSKAEIAALQENFPGVCSAMIGRGLIADPGMLSPGGTTADALEAFCDALLEEYLVVFGGSRNAMFRLKENWSLLIHKFDGAEKLGKALRKTTSLEEFHQLTHTIIRTLPMKESVAGCW